MSAAQQACKIEDQYTTDQLYFYTLAMSNLKVRKLPLQQHQKENLGILLTKETQDLHTENDKTLVKETEEGPKRPQYVGRLDSWMRLTVVKDSNPPKETYRFNVIPAAGFLKLDN